MFKVLCALYDDPTDGYPSTYARDSLPALERYADGHYLIVGALLERSQLIPGRRPSVSPLPPDGRQTPR